MDGTIYNTKEELVAAIEAAIKTNTNKETTSQVIQDKFKDVIETLWNELSGNINTATNGLTKSGGSVLLGGNIDSFTAINIGEEGVKGIIQFDPAFGVVFQSGTGINYVLDDNGFRVLNDFATLNPTNAISKQHLMDYEKSSEPETAFVNSTYGSDATAVVGSRIKKFQTILAAANSAAKVIIIEPGSYTDTAFLKGSFTKTYYFQRNAVVTVTGSIDTTGFNGSVFGHGTFISNATSGSLFQNSGGTMYFEFHSITVNNANVSLIGSGSNNNFTFKGNSYFAYNYSSKGFITLSYLGVLGYPVSGGNNLGILFKDCYLYSSVNAVNLIPLSRAAISIQIENCICSAETNGSIFGRFNAAATSPKVIIKNSLLKAGGTYASEDSIGATNYVYLDNNVVSNKAFHTNTGLLAGTLNVNTNYINI